jgi:RHS repeat-associated protein
VPESTNRFVYDGWNLVAILNPQNYVTQAFLWGQDLSGTEDGAGGIGGLLAVFETSAGQISNAHFACYDGNGNVTALMRVNDKSTSARYEYSPYGEVLRATGIMPKVQPFRHATRFMDEESGLVVHVRRLRSAAMGRWISRDPIEEQDVSNLYQFCRNDPLNSVDGLGMEGTLIEEEAATEVSGDVEGGAAAQALSFLKQVRNTVDTFNQIQDITDAVMKSDFGTDEGSEDTLGAFLNIGNQIMAVGVGGNSSAARKGMRMHKIFYRAAQSAGMRANRSIGAGLRPDALDLAAKIVYELKPWTRSGRRLGAKQLKLYLDQLRKTQGKKWIGQLIFY